MRDAFTFIVNPVRTACVLLCASLANGRASNVFMVGAAACVSDSLTVSQAVRMTGALIFDSHTLARVVSFPCPMCIHCVLLIEARA